MFFMAQTWPKRSRSKRNRPTIPCRLPPDIIFEILSYLPPKVVIRCMTVCKAWNSTIQSQEFIKAHHDRSTKANSRTVVLVYNYYKTDDPNFGVSVDLDRDEFKNIVRIEQPFQKAIVLGYCNGLVCVRNDTSKRFAVWNPSIQRYKRIPYTAAMKLPADYRNRSVMFGFGYDSTNDDYKLVRVVGSEVTIYSLKSNSWRNIQSLPYMMDFRTYSSAADSHLSFSNGALHWLICHISDERIKRVVSLDLATEKYAEFPIPPVHLNYPTKVKLEVLGGYLCVSGTEDLSFRSTGILMHFGDEFWNLWIMKEYGVASSWTKLSSWIYSRENISTRWYRYRKPLLFSETREKVLMQGGRTLCWYDLEKKNREDVVIPYELSHQSHAKLSIAICVGNQLRLLDGDSLVSCH